MERNPNKILISVISLFLGAFLIYDSVYTIWDYLAYPSILRLIWIPYSRLIIKGLFGLLLTAAGLSLLFRKQWYKKLYNLIAFSLIFLGFDIVLLGDSMSSYGFENIGWIRSYFVVYWIIAFFILRWTGKGENVRTILINKTSLTYWGIGALIVILPDLVYFFLITDYY